MTSTTVSRNKPKAISGLDGSPTESGNYPAPKAFKPAKREKIPSLIIGQIRTAIMQGKYKPGQALPHERDLIEQFKVSRHTLREALRALEAMGLIYIKRGASGGPYVSEIDFDTAREYFTSFMHFQNISRTDLSELRLFMEPYIARKVAQTATDEDIAALEGIQEKCQQLIDQGKSLVGAEAEVLFHVYLAKQTKNAIMWVIMDFINNLLAQLKIEMNPGLDFSHKVLKAHQKILNAIKKHDPDQAERAMRRHIIEVNKGLDALQVKINKNSVKKKPL
jgi:GntR family transcriptional repressor for pyruvate dehydrogenase complex